MILLSQLHTRRQLLLGQTAAKREKDSYETANGQTPEKSEPLRSFETLCLLQSELQNVEAGEGSGIVPSWALAACRNRRVVMSRLINLVANLDFHRISDHGKKLPPGAEEFTSFLQSYIARWAGRVGIL